MGVCSLPRGHTYIHESHANSPPWPMPPRALGPARNGQSSLLSDCLPVRLSLAEDTELPPSSLRPGAFLLWTSQKLAFVPFPPFGDRNLQDCCPGPPTRLPTTGAVTPRQALAGCRRVFDGPAPLRPEGRSGAARALGLELGGGHGAGHSKSEGPSCTDERTFLFFGPEGSSGCLWFFLFFFKEKKMIKSSKQIFLVTEKLI